MTRHRVTVLGTGKMGAAIAEALLQRSAHDVLVRGSELGSVSARKLAERLTIREASDTELAESEIVFVAVPEEAIPAAAATLKGHRGIVVSVIVGGGAGFDGNKSCAERLADALPGVRVASAFTTLFDVVVRNPGDAENTSIFVFSDDEGAKAVVRTVAEELGFDSLDGGGLSYALYGETLGMFVARLALSADYGANLSIRAFQTVAQNAPSAAGH